MSTQTVIASAPASPPASPPKYLPTFAEETFIAHCYGTDEEIQLFEKLIEDPTDRNALVNLIILRLLCGPLAGWRSFQ